MMDLRRRDSTLWELEKYLATQPQGAVTEPDDLVGLLSACWDRFVGSGETAMAAYKLDRMENVRWYLPTLTFEVERHGGAVMGSTRAEMQKWTLDMDALTAKTESVGFRQIRPSQRRLEVPRLAEEVYKLIIHGSKDPRLRWNEDGSVRVRIGEILPKDSAVKQTLDGRHALSVGIHGEDRARADGQAVHVDRAGAALVLAAALFGAGEAQVVPQDVKQGAVDRDVDLLDIPVDRDLDVFAHGSSAISPRRAGRPPPGRAGRGPSSGGRDTCRRRGRR